MAFSLREFVMKTIRGMIEGGVLDYKVRQYALGWYEKGIITEEDIIEIEMLLEAKNAVTEEETEEETTTE